MVFISFTASLYTIHSRIINQDIQESSSALHFVTPYNNSNLTITFTDGLNVAIGIYLTDTRSKGCPRNFIVTLVDDAVILIICDRNIRSIFSCSCVHVDTDRIEFHYRTDISCIYIKSECDAGRVTIHIRIVQCRIFFVLFNGCTHFDCVSTSILRIVSQHITIHILLVFR